MKRILKIVYSGLMGAKNYFRWKKQAKHRCINLDKATDIKNAIELNNDEKILVVVPHPDDELIGCHSIIKNYHSKTVVFYSGMLGGNTDEKNRITRTAEFMKYCEAVGVEYVVNSGDLSERFEKIIKNYNLKYIFVPSVVDWHEEHRKLFLLTEEIVQKLKRDISIFCYKVTVPIPEKYVTHYSVMSHKEQNCKWQLFKKIYVSQNHMPVQRFKIAEDSYKKEMTAFAAEVFMELGENTVSREYVCDVDKKKINDLIEILNCSEREYKRAFGKMSR